MSYLGQILYYISCIFCSVVAGGCCPFCVVISKLTKCRQLQLAESFSSMIEWRLPWTSLLDNNIFSKKWGETSCRRLLFQTENRSSFSSNLKNLLTFFACFSTQHETVSVFSVSTPVNLTINHSSDYRTTKGDFQGNFYSCYLVVDSF